MKIKDIKTAINGVITVNGGTVYSSETKEGYEKPAYFTKVIPLRVTRISNVYDEVELDVEIHYESSSATEEECIITEDLINRWFAEPINVGDRVIKPPEEIQHTIDDSAVLYSDFTLITTVIHNEDAYITDLPEMENLEFNLIKKEG